jgi:hypothetical protein
MGSFEVEVKVSGAVHPGQVIINHAWEPYQFTGGRSHDVVAPSPINPLQIAGGYFHLQPAPYMGSAGGVDRATRIEVERLARSPARRSGGGIDAHRHGVPRDFRPSWSISAGQLES